MATTPQLLPAGAFTTSGNQIVDQYGNPVRIACVGWSGSNSRNGVPEGLSQANYQALLNQVVQIGFNCIRLTFCDASCIANDMPYSGAISTSLNPTMNGLSCLQVHDLIVTYCATIGLRVVIDSHNNEGTNNENYGANQPNGLWYDKGGASNGTDQGGNTGTVTDAAFLANWQMIATRYKNSPAILGYDLRNEPNTTGTQGPGNGGGSTWGDGSNRDIRAMYTRVGNAILAIDPRPLIIAEGPQNYNGTFATGLQADGIDYGSGSNFTGGSGDLSGVRQYPIALNTPNKVVYSVHEYPPETSGSQIDAGGQSKINLMNAIWGFLVKNNTAPVWVGEMGSYFNGTAAQIASSTTWMNMMIAYLNGTANNGPRFTGVQQGIGMDWWTLAVDESGGQVPDFGILTAWQGGSARQNQYLLYSQLFFTGSAASGITAPPAPTSANGTIAPPAASIVDANANTWTINSAGQVVVGGVADVTTSSVIALAYISGLVWKETSGQLWAYKATPTDTWTSGPNPLGGAPVPSINGTVVTTAGPAITDANGNLWTINTTGRVLINGVVDPALNACFELAFVSNQIWVRTGSSTWYYRTLPTDPWLPTAGTSISPLTPGVPQGPANATWNIINAILAWTPNQPVLLGARVSNNGVAYQCVTAGTTAASGGPSGTAGNILDGSARWKWLATIDFLDKSGALTALPAAFTGNLVWQFWNCASQTTANAVPFLTLQGHTMPGFSLTLTAAPSDSLRTTLASQSVPLAMNTAYGASFLQPLAVGAAINYLVINDPTVIIDGLGFLDPLPSSSGSTMLQSSAGNTSLIVRNSIFDGAGQAGGAYMIECSSSGTVLFTNCLFIDRQPTNAGNPTIVVQGSVTAARFVNCTFIAINAPGVSPIATGSTPTTIRNCAIFGYSSNGNNTSYTFDHCVTDQANWGAGIDGGGNVYSKSAAAQFISPTTDWRPLAGSALLNAGVIDFTDIPAGDDIARTPRTQGPAWDAGCWARLSYAISEVRPPPIKFW